MKNAVTEKTMSINERNPKYVFGFCLVRKSSL